MSKGQIFHSTFSEYTDPYTGTVVKRLTDPSILSHHMYFYNRMTTSDGQYLLICQKRDEGRQLYTLNLHNGEIRQITEGDGVGQTAPCSHMTTKPSFISKTTAFTRWMHRLLKRTAFTKHQKAGAVLHLA